MKTRQASFKLTLHIQPQGGTTSISVPLASADMMYVPNGKNTAVVQLPVGFYTAATQLPDGTFREIFVPNSITWHRGDWAWIVVDSADDTLTKGGVVFSGYIYDYGPAALQFGSFAVTVTLFGTINFLGTGTLQSSTMVPGMYLGDNENWYSQFTQQPSPGVTEATPQPYMLSQLVKDNGFNVEFLNLLKAIASGTGAPKDSVSQFITDYFGGNPNILALALLNKIDASKLVFRTFLNQQLSNALDGDATQQKSSLIDGLVTQINTRFNSNWKYMSFLDRIIELANEMFFSIIELGNPQSGVQFQPGLGYNAVLSGGSGINPFSQILLVPSVPFFNSSAAIHINPDTYSAVQQAQDSSGILRDFKGSVLLPAVGTVIQKVTADQQIIGFFDGTKQQTSQFLQFNGSPSPDLIGQVIVTPVNPLFVMGTWSSRANAAEEHGVGQSGHLVNVTPDFLGNTLAMMAYMNAKYAGRTMFVTSPFFRADIAPLTPVRLNLPATHEIAAALESAVVYGQVRSVVVSLDATHAKAQTRIEIGYIRTKYDQETYVDPNFPSSEQDGANPLWATNWNGSTLTGIPYTTPQSFIGGGEFTETT